MQDSLIWTSDMLNKMFVDMFGLHHFYLNWILFNSFHHSIHLLSLEKTWNRLSKKKYCYRLTDSCQLFFFWPVKCKLWAHFKYYINCCFGFLKQFLNFQWLSSRDYYYYSHYSLYLFLHTTWMAIIQTNTTAKITKNDR